MANQLVLTVDADVVLAATMGLSVILRPARARHLAFWGHAQEAAKGMAVTDLAFGLLVSQVIRVLQNQPLEHHEKRVGDR